MTLPAAGTGSIADERTIDQDPMYALRLVVDIATRALSSGVARCHGEELRPRSSSTPLLQVAQSHTPTERAVRMRAH